MVEAGSSLVFDQYAFHHAEVMHGTETNHVLYRFIEHVEESLRIYSQSKPIDALTVAGKFNRSNRLDGDFYVLRWINYVVFKKVRDFSFSYFTWKTCTGWPYRLPDSIYQSSSIQVLRLFGCRLPTPTLYSIIQISIRKLPLSRVCIDRQTLNILLLRSSLLEELKINLCRGFDAIAVVGDMLEVVDLYISRTEPQIIAVAAPKLRCFSYAGSFRNVWDIFMASGRFDGVEEMKLHDVSLQQHFLRILPSFPNLCRLQLERCENVLDFMEFSTSQIVRCGDVLSELLEPDST